MHFPVPRITRPRSLDFPATTSAKCRSRAFLCSRARQRRGAGRTRNCNGGSYTIDTFQTIDAALTQTYQNHTFKYGFEHLIQQNAGGNLAASAGSFSFGSATNTSSDSWTCQNPIKNCGASQGNGSNVAQFLLGLPVSGSFSTNPTAFWSQHYTAAYFQDNWRVSSKTNAGPGPSLGLPDRRDGAAQQGLHPLQPDLRADRR